MKLCVVLLIAALSSTLPDQLQTSTTPTTPNIELTWWDPFRMGELQSNAPVNVCVRKIWKQALETCGLNPDRYLRCCPGNAADCLKQFYCGRTEGAAAYFDALIQIGAALPTCRLVDSCRALDAEDIGPLWNCLEARKDALVRCPHMDSRTPEVRCRGQNETLACFRDVVAACNDTDATVTTRFLVAVARADYLRYCPTSRDDTKPEDTTPEDITPETNKSDNKGDNVLKWLLAFGVLALVSLAVAGLVVLFVLWKLKKRKEASQSALSPSLSNATASGEASKSQNEAQESQLDHKTDSLIN